jgi:hypothetical protein
MLFPQDPRLAVETPWEQSAAPQPKKSRASRKRDKKSTSPLPGSLKYSIKPRRENNKIQQVHSGKHTKNDGQSQFLMGKSTISMAIFNSYVCLPQGMYNKYLT